MDVFLGELLTLVQAHKEPVLSAGAVRASVCAVLGRPCDDDEYDELLRALDLDPTSQGDIDASALEAVITTAQRREEDEIFAENEVAGQGVRASEDFMHVIDQRGPSVLRNSSIRRSASLRRSASAAPSEDMYDVGASDDELNDSRGSDKQRDPHSILSYEDDRSGLASQGHDDRAGVDDFLAALSPSGNSTAGSLHEGGPSPGTEGYMLDIEDEVTLNT
jgi:hypothetical protein